jgi:large conductance mechanosensitive channel
VINFLIIAFAIFMVVKAVNNLKRKEESAPPAPTEKACPFCTTNIPIKAKRCPHCTSQLEPA